MIIYITFYRQVSIVYYNTIIKLAIYKIHYTWRKGWPRRATGEQRNASKRKMTLHKYAI